MGVLIKPGAIQFTVIFLLATSNASDLVMPTNAALEAT